MKKGQALLIIVFTLTFSLFSLYLLLAPIKDKLLRIKELESIYQAIANAEKGLEASSLSVFKNINLSLQKQTNSYSTTDCGGIIHQGRTGLCLQIIYQPAGSPWTNEEKFRADNFIFIITFNGEKVQTLKTISDGFVGRVVRTVLLGASQ